ncbi:MAG TPA: hypothetical protein VLT45_08930 [Kofleriaceae bacterium]|nr:hypothetical protein [Kofleriaceae bacterium]
MERRQRISELCIGGDWACRRGDTASLAAIAEELAARVHEPLHCKLVELAEHCRASPDRAADEWATVKAQLLLAAEP